MTTPEMVGITATGLGIVVVLGKGLRNLMMAFHNEHVAPAIAGLINAIAHNTEVTATQTAALAKSNAAQEKGFERLGDIIEDHERRLTHLEQPPRPIKSARIRKAS
jgi:hypothetical protein